MPLLSSCSLFVQFRYELYSLLLLARERTAATTTTPAATTTTPAATTTTPAATTTTPGISIKIK